MEITYAYDTSGVDWTRLKDDLIADDFDNGRTSDELRRSFENSAVVVFARHEGRIIGKARALSDRVCNAYVVDVWTHSDYRRRGVASRMMNALAERLEGQHIYLFTDDAEKLYHGLGYRRQGIGMSMVSGRWLNRSRAEETMGKVHDLITDDLRAFIGRQHIFFVATAPLSAEGHVNLSPKGMDCFRVLGPTQVGYMDLIGSGNETAAHTLENGRITFLFCAFEGSPNILRLYGSGRAVRPGNPEWDELATQFTIYPSTRQLVVADITRVQTSCGFGVPLYEYAGERDHHFKWADRKGAGGLAAYQAEKNRVSLDGLPTGPERS